MIMQRLSLMLRREIFRGKGSAPPASRPGRMMTQPQQNPGSRTIASQTLRPGTTRLLCALHTLPRLYLPYPDMWSGCTLLATSLNVCVLSMLVQGNHVSQPSRS